MKRVAAIDCGTNSIRLLISDIDEEKNQATDVVRELRIVRLGEGVDKTKAFSPKALERTFKAIDEYEEILKKHNVENLKFVATSATRDALNKAMFIKGVIDRLRVVPEVIPGTLEAKLSFEGATNSFDFKFYVAIYNFCCICITILFFHDTKSPTTICFLASLTSHK